MKGFWDMTRWMDGLFSPETKGTLLFLVLSLIGIGIWQLISKLWTQEAESLQTPQAHIVSPEPEADPNVIPIRIEAAEPHQEQPSEEFVEVEFRDAFNHYPIPTQSQLKKKLTDGTVGDLEGTIWVQHISDLNGFPLCRDHILTYYFENFFGMETDVWGGEIVFMWRISPEGNLERLNLMSIYSTSGPGDRVGAEWWSSSLDAESDGHTTKLDQTIEWEATPFRIEVLPDSARMLTLEGKPFAYYCINAGRED